MGGEAWEGQSPLPDIMKFKSTRISTESETLFFSPYEKCRTKTKRSSVESDVIRYVIIVIRPLYFLLVPISFPRCPKATSHEVH